MAEFSRTPKRRDPELEGLNAQYRTVRQGYDAATATQRNLIAQRSNLMRESNAMPVVIEGPRNQARLAGYSSATPGFQRTLGGLDAQLSAATQKRESFTKPLQDVTAGFRDYSDRTNANTLQRRLGITPIPSAPAARAATPATPVAPRAVGAVDTSSKPARAAVAVNGGGGPGSGGSGAPPAVPAMVPGMRTLSGQGNVEELNQQTGARAPYTIAGQQRQSVASSRGRFGENVYDNASIERLTGKPIDQVRKEAAAGAVGFQRGLPAVGSPVANHVSAVGGGQGASIKNPGEEERRLENALSGATFRTARSRGARAQQDGMVRGLMDLYGQRQQIEADANRNQVNANTALAVEGMRSDTAIEDGNADRAANLQRTMVDADLQREATTAQGRRFARTLTTTNGTTSVVRDDGSVTPLTDAQGNPVRERVASEGAVTPQDELKFLGDQRAALLQDPGYGVAGEDGKPDPRVSQVEQIDARIEQIFGRGAPAGGKQIKRTGTLNGRKVVEYSDGTTEYTD